MPIDGFPSLLSLISPRASTAGHSVWCRVCVYMCVARRPMCGCPEERVPRGRVGRVGAQGTPGPQAVWFRQPTAGLKPTSGSGCPSLLGYLFFLPSREGLDRTAQEAQGAHCTLTLPPWGLGGWGVLRLQPSPRACGWGGVTAKAGLGHPC